MQQTDHAGVSTNSGFSLVIGPEYWLLIGPSYQTKITYIIRRQSGLCSARYICLYFSQGNLVIIVPRNWFHCCSLINSDQIYILSLRIYNCNPTTIKYTLHKHSWRHQNVQSSYHDKSVSQAPGCGTEYISKKTNNLDFTHHLALRILKEKMTAQNTTKRNTCMAQYKVYSKTVLCLCWVLGVKMDVSGSPVVFAWVDSII